MDTLSINKISVNHITWYKITDSGLSINGGLESQPELPLVTIVLNDVVVNTAGPGSLPHQAELTCSCDLHNLGTTRGLGGNLNINVEVNPVLTVTIVSNDGVLTRVTQTSALNPEQDIIINQTHISIVTLSNTDSGLEEAELRGRLGLEWELESHHLIISEGELEGSSGGPLEPGQRHYGESGAGNGLAHLVDSNALDHPLIIHLEVVDGQQATIRLVHDVNTLSDEDGFIILLPENVGLGCPQGLGSELHSLVNISGGVSWWTQDEVWSNVDTRGVNHESI